MDNSTSASAVQPPSRPCRRCQSPGPHTIGAGPHPARLLCGATDAAQDDGVMAFWRLAHSATTRRIWALTVRSSRAAASWTIASRASGRITEHVLRVGANLVRGIPTSLSLQGFSLSIPQKNIAHYVWYDFIFFTIKKYDDIIQYTTPPPRLHRGKACCVWLLSHLWTVAPVAAQTLARWLIHVWPGFKER